MRAISIKCPNCGGSLEAPETAQKVVCSYCGTHSRIQHRTRILERKIQLPPPPPQERHMPVAKQRHGTRWVFGLSSLLPLAIAAGSSIYAMKSSGELAKIGEAISQARDAIQPASASAAVGRPAGSGSLLLHDVNGDAAPDIILQVRYVSDKDRYRLAAYDGLSGERLWESKPFGNHSDALDGKTGLLGDFLVQSDSRGNMSAFSASTGGSLWKISMGEKLDEMCGIDDAHLALGLRDKNWKSLQLSDGALTALDGRPSGCRELSEYKKRGHPEEIFASSSRKLRVPKLKIDGFKARDSLELADAPGRHLLLGHKMPGTRVPMIALIHDSQLDQSDDEGSGSSRRKPSRGKVKLVLDWSSELPALDPLRVRQGAPELVAMNSLFVAAVYEPDEGPAHLVCFAREGGTRLWDKPVPGNRSPVLSAIDIASARVYISQWGRIDAFDAGDGQLVFTLGE